MKIKDMKNLKDNICTISSQELVDSPQAKVIDYSMLDISKRDMDNKLLVLLLEKYKAEFESGKKLNPSFKSGYKKALPVILDLFAVSVFVNALVAIFMSGFAFSFAIAMLINNAFGAITSLLIMLWFSRMYLKINNVKGERLNFFKGDNVDEIKTK